MATKPSSPALQGGNSLATGLNLYLLLNEGSGNPSDLSGNGNNGTLAGGASWTTDAAGNAVSCTGGGYISVPIPSVSAGSDWSMLIIHKPTTWPGGFTTLLDDAGRVWSEFIDTSGNSSSRGTMDSITNALSLGMTAGSLWQLVMQRSGTNVSAFVNGAQIGTTTFNNNSSGGVISVHFGNNPSGGGSNYNGVYDTIAFWTRALTSTEIAALVTDPYAVVRPSGGGVITSPLWYDRAYDLVGGF